MIKYKTISYYDEETFHYELIEKKIFATGEQLGYWDMYTPDGKLVARCRGSIVSVLPGYMWDGSTVVGEYYEDEVTMEASLIHDVLYNANKNPDDIKVPFSLWKADSIFADYLVRLYRKNGTFMQKHIIPKLYKWGLWVLGTPWKFGNNKYYEIEKAQQ